MLLRTEKAIRLCRNLGGVYNWQRPKSRAYDFYVLVHTATRNCEPRDSTCSDGGAVLVDTPCFQAIVGRADSYPVTDLTLDLETSFAAVQVASLDGRPITDSAKLLLVAGSRVANTGMRWKDTARHTLGEAWGSAPTRIEPVLGVVTLWGLASAQIVTLQPLDPVGQPDGDAVPFMHSTQGICVSLPGTIPWYVIGIAQA